MRSRTRDLLRAQAVADSFVAPQVQHDVAWNDQAFTSSGTSYTMGQAKAASQTYNAGALFMNSASTGKG